MTTKSSQPPDGGSDLNLPAFGQIESERVLAMDDLFAVVSDKFPVSPGHTLIIPRRAQTRFHELNAAEKLRLLEWVEWVQERLQQTLTPPPEAFNLGVNDGNVAGQQIKRNRLLISMAPMVSQTDSRV
ncbi:MAG: HIT family protein [Verrucomicrobiia bacterium]